MADGFAFENYSTELVSTDREVDRAHNDPGSLAALHPAKEMYRGTGTLRTGQWNYTSRHNRRRL